MGDSIETNSAKCYLKVRWSPMKSERTYKWNGSERTENGKNQIDLKKKKI